MWGRGHVCVFPEGVDYPIWVLERAVRHCHGPGEPGGTPDEEAETDAICNDVSTGVLDSRSQTPHTGKVEETCR